MDKKTILIFQGGGALGAYECGAYKALVHHHRLDSLAVVAGTSIGAINASLIASHYHSPDHGAKFLEEFWTTELSTPSLPFFPPFVDNWQRWNAVWTGLLMGYPRLCTPRLPVPFALVFRPPLTWQETHSYDTQLMEQTVREHFESYGPRKADPRLMVTAVDLGKGALTVFDSWQNCISPAHIVASGSLPPNFPAKEINGKFYWDGGLWSNSPLPDVLRTMRKSGPLATDYDVYMICLFPKPGREPHNNWEVWQRMAEISYTDKTAYDQSASEWANKYIELARVLKEHAHQLPSAVSQKLDEQKKDIDQFEKRVVLNITTIDRGDIPDEAGEHISKDCDFSAERIRELMKQGYLDTERKLIELDSASQRYLEKAGPLSEVR